MKQYLEIGKITKLQGLKGEVRVQYYCDEPQMLCDFETLYLGKEKSPVEPVKARCLKSNVAVLKLKGIDTPEDAETLIGKLLYFDRGDIELPENTWFISDVLGLTVLDADSGRVYGTVDDIYQNGSADVYSIKAPDGRKLMFPSIPEVLINTDLDAGKIYIRPLPGLFDEPENKDRDDGEDA